MLIVCDLPDPVWWQTSTFTCPMPCSDVEVAAAVVVRAPSVLVVGTSVLVVSPLVDVGVGAVLETRVVDDPCVVELELELVLVDPVVVTSAATFVLGCDVIWARP